MTRDVRLYIEDILDSIAKIEQYIKNIDQQRFLTDTQIQDSVLRRLEIIGEAVKNVPSSFRDKYPQIPWKNVAGLRDILIHEYFGVNMRRAWKVISEDLSGLKLNLTKVKKDIESSSA